MPNSMVNFKKLEISAIIFQIDNKKKNVYSSPVDPKRYLHDV